MTILETLYQLVALAIPYDGDRYNTVLEALAIPYDGHRYDTAFTV